MWGGNHALFVVFYYIIIILFVFDQSCHLRNIVYYGPTNIQDTGSVSLLLMELIRQDQSGILDSKLFSRLSSSSSSCSLPLSLTLTDLRSPPHPCWLHNFHTDMWEATQVQQSHLQQAESGLCLFKCRISWRKKNHIQPVWRLECFKVILSNVHGFDLF